MMDYKNILESENLHICEDGIIRDNKKHPIVNNDIYQELVMKVKRKEKLTAYEENLYGYSIMTLGEILSNCKMVRFQEPEVREDCKCEAIMVITKNVPKYFDDIRGSMAYSFAYRCGYTAMTHVLESYNMQKDIREAVDKRNKEIEQLCNTGRKVSTNNNNIH